MQNPDGAESLIRSGFAGTWRLSMVLDPLGAPVPAKRGFPPGVSLEEAMRTILPEEAWEHVRLRFEGDPETSFILDWKRVRPKAGDRVVMVLLPGFNYSKFFKYLAAAALFVTAGYLLAPAVGWAALTKVGWWLGKTTLYAGLIDSQERPDPIPDGKTHFLRGGRNAPAPWQPVPRPLGVRRFSPPLGAQPFWETRGGDTPFLHMLLCWGMGEIDLTDLRIGTQPFSAFREHATIEHYGPHLAKDSSEVDFPRVTPLSPNIRLGTEWVVRETPPMTNAMGVTFVFPNGLYRQDDRGRAAPIHVDVVVQYRRKPKAGETVEWTTALRHTERAQQQNRIIRSFRIDEDKAEHVWVPGTCSWKWVDGRRCVERADQGHCRRWEPTRERKWVCESGSWVRKPKKVVPAVYEVRVRRTNAEASFAGGAWTDRVDWFLLNSFREGRPILKDGMTCSVVTIESSDDTTGSIDNVNAIVSPRIPVFDQTANGWPDSSPWGDWTFLSGKPGVQGVSNMDSMPNGVRMFSTSTSNRPPGAGWGIAARFAESTTREVQIACYRRTDRQHRFVTRVRERASESAPWQAWGVDANGQRIFGVEPHNSATGWNFNGLANAAYLAAEPGGVAGTSGPRAFIMGEGDTPPGYSEWYAILDPSTDSQKAVLVDGRAAKAWTRKGAARSSKPPPATENPADILRYAMTSKYVNPHPIPEADVNNASLAAFWAHCAKEGLTYSKILVGAPMIRDVLEEIASAGFGSVSQDDNVWSCIVDGAKPAPRQMLTAVSVEGFTESFSHIPVPDAVRVRFPNEGRDYAQDMRVVYRDGVTAASARTYQDMSIDFVTDPDSIHKIARRYLAVAEHRPFVWRGRVGPEYSTLRRGERVFMAHDSAAIGQRAGWVSSVSGRRVGLDNPVTFGSGPHSLYVRKRDGSGVAVASATGTGTTQSVLLDDASGVAVGDLWQFGPSGAAVEDAVVTAMEPAGDGSMSVTMVPYRTAVVDSDETIPPFESVITEPTTPNYAGPPPPQVDASQIVSDESALPETLGGSKLPAIKIPITLRTPDSADPNITGARQIRVRWKRTDQPASEWQTRDHPAEQGVILLQPVEARRQYDIRLRTLDTRLGESREVKVVHTAVGLGAPPPDVPALTLNRSGGASFLTWKYDDPPVDLSHFEIRFANERNFRKWERMRRLEGSYPRDSNTTGALSLGGTYAIKAVDVAGNYSRGAAFVNAPSLPTSAKVLQDLKYDEAQWPGSLVDVVASGPNLQLGSTTRQGGSLFMSQWPALNQLGFLSTASDTEYGGSDGEGVYTAPAVDCGVGTFLVSVESEVRISNILALNQLWRKYNATLLRDVGVLGEAASAEDYFVDAEIRTATTRTPGAGGGVYDWSDWSGLIAGDYEARHLQVRLRLRTLNNEITPIIDRFRVKASVAARTETGTGTTPVSVTFDGAFYETPVVIAAANLNDGERIATTATRSGATVGVVNSSGAAQAGRSVFWNASGHGEEAS